MKILIGSPIHISKDYYIEPWIKNVSHLEYPFDLLLVDCSPDRSYIEKVKNLLKKYKIENYKIEYLEINQEQPEGERLGRSREIIRKEVLAKDYDFWFNWECNFSLPYNVLERLIQVITAGNYALVSHVPALEEVSLQPNNLFGVDLISRATLMRYGFLVEYPDMPNIWHGNGLWLKKRLLRDGYKIVELDIKNPSHLNKYKKRDGIRLNLGCGTKLKDGYINIDIQEPCDLKHDLRKPLPFTDNSIDEIYSEGNVISHFSREEWKFLRKEISRVLKPHGKLELKFIDFEYILKAFLENKNGQKWNWWLETIFSGQQNDYEFAKNGFTADRLIDDLSKENMEKFFIKQMEEPGYIHLIGFKRLILSVLITLMFIPRAIWADLAYFATALTPEDDSPSLEFLTSIPKRGKKYFSAALSIEQSQLQL